MESNRPAFEESFNEVLIQVDLFAHSGTDEHQATVKKLYFSLLGNEEESDRYELNIAVKDYSLMHEDCIIALYNIKLTQFYEQDS
ncbi:unnamed protein product [Rotaria sordida]|uniref:Uncharacterized protein n=1 Tax=Rotaria sordida TaxID=392033 RepID=A0A813R1Q5_9BILA|nr:unnamed protein product [Rotaria sordida]CAF0967716.1 unnamed protein product [Rotaria sordida]CAF0968405.1 unnamed protein product [Rotaria sordida]